MTVDSQQMHIQMLWQMVLRCAKVVYTVDGCAMSRSLRPDHRAFG